MDLDIDTINLDDDEGTIPNDIVTPESIFSLSFHPNASYLAIGQVNGVVEIHHVEGRLSQQINSIQAHSSGVRALEFTEEGNLLVSASSDKTINILDCKTQKNVVTINAGKHNPHQYGISSANICTENLIATGDDDGLICIWDIRTRKPSFKYHEHGDFVSQMLFFSDVNQLVSGSGDTCLGVYDLKAGCIIDYSEKRKDEIMSIAFIPEINGIIAGTPAGSLPVWRYNSWSRPYDVFEYHPADVDVILTYNDNIVLTGACDGIVRVLQVHPIKRNLCQVGGNTRRQPISRMSMRHDRKVLACTGIDNVVSFVDVEFLMNDEELDRLRNRAEQRHFATLREATLEMEAEERATEEELEEESESSLDDEDDNEKKDCIDINKIKQAIIENTVEGKGLNNKGEDKKRSRIVIPLATDSEDESSDISDSDSVNSSEDDNNNNNNKDKEDDKKETKMSNKSARQKQRERVAAAKWLKEEKKKKVNFKFERRRRRVGGFWGDLN